MTKGGREGKLYFMGHVVMENRHGLAVGALGADKERVPDAATLLPFVLVPEEAPG
jgi:hypothetical protein